MSANYQHLRAFHAIAREGSVTRAARRLNVAQPTLSQQLKALEARHGVSLFESRRAPLRLSAAGRDLYELTERLFAAALDVDEMLGEAGAEACGSLRLGSDSPTYAARLIEAFRRRHPHTAVQVRMGNANDVMRWLAAAEVDAAVAADPPGDGMFIYEPLYVDHLSCALPTGHPLAGSASIPIATLAREVLLTREGKSKTRAFTERVFAEAGVGAAHHDRASEPRDHPRRRGAWARGERVLFVRMPAPTRASSTGRSTPPAASCGSSAISSVCRRIAVM